MLRSPTSRIISILISLNTIMGCSNTNNEANNTNQLHDTPNAEACSIKLPGVHFTASLNGALQNLLVDSATVTIKSLAKTDYFNEPDGSITFHSAPLLLCKIDNKKPFSFTTKVTPTFGATYDAGALYLYANASLWQKFAFEMDERGKTRIVSVRTIETSDDNNHEIISAQRHVYLKISSDTKSIGFYYSIDSQTWNLARVYKNSYPETIWLGISAQSPIGSGNTASFADCVLSDQAITDFRSGM